MDRATLDRDIQAVKKEFCSIGMKDADMKDFLKTKGLDFTCAKEKAVKYTMSKYQCVPPPGMSPAIDETTKSDIAANCKVADVERAKAMKHAEDKTQ